MKISIIVPVYNSEKYLQKLINSILAQTYKNYEVIFVNDGSTDNSLNILKKEAEKNANIKIFTKKNEGPGIARKFGFNNATGDLIYFIDSDDWIPSKDTLERIHIIFQNKNIDILMFNRDIYCDDKKIGTFTPFLDGNLDAGLYSIDKLRCHSVRGGLGLKIFKYDLMKEEYFTNGNNFEDFYTTYRYLENCKNFSYEDETFYCINRDNDNQSLTKEKNTNKYIQAIEKILEVYSKSNNYNIKNSISGIILELYMQYVYNVMKLKYSKAERKVLKNKINKMKEILMNHDVDYITKKYSLKKKITYYLLIRRKK